MANIDSAPGFKQCAFDAIREKVEEAKKNNKDVIVGLIFDEMFIRRQSQFDKATKEFLGHISAGIPVEYEEFSPLSKEALLLMVASTKIPIGYILTCGLCAEDKCALLDEAMRKLKETGVKLASITSDSKYYNIQNAGRKIQ